MGSSESPVWALLNSMKERQKKAEGSAQRNRQLNENLREAVAALENGFEKAAKNKDFDGKRVLDSLISPNTRGPEADSFIKGSLEQSDKKPADSIRALRTSQKSAQGFLVVAENAHQRATVLSKDLKKSLERPGK